MVYYRGASVNITIGKGDGYVIEMLTSGVNSKVMAATVSETMCFNNTAIFHRSNNSSVAFKGGLYMHFCPLLL